MLIKFRGRSSVKIHSDCVAFTHTGTFDVRAKHGRAGTRGRKPASAQAYMSDCHLSTADCNTLLFKTPSVHINAGPSRAVTANLSEAERTAFEHLIAHALGETAAVRWVTRTFAARLRRFVVEGAALNGSSASVALMRAFTAASCGPHNTGYVGASLPAIETALASGNLREVWALVYVMSKSRYFTHLLLALLTPRGSGVTPATLAARLGMDAAELSARHELVVATQRTHGASTSLRYAQGIPDYDFEPFDSWVRFDFDSHTRTGITLWRGARTRRAGGCAVDGRATNDPSIEPPLSPAELAYQCGGAPPPCALRWQPGGLCFELPMVSP